MATLNVHDWDLIAAHPLFKVISPEHRREIVERALVVAADESSTIFHRGEPHTGFYLVLAGAVKLERCAANGRCLVLRVVRAGESFGESSLLDDAVDAEYVTSAHALDRVRMLFFSKELVGDLLCTHPDMCRALLRSVASGLIGLLDRFELVSLYNVRSRLAWHLVSVSERTAPTGPIHLDVPKSVLAAQLGTIPETLSRAFKDLRKAGCITTSGRFVGILDRSRLAEYARGTFE